MKTLPMMLAFCCAVLFFGCATKAKPDPIKYGNELMATLNGNGLYIDRMNEALAVRNYDKAEAISRKWEEQLDSSLADVAKILPIEHDTGLKNAVEKGLESYKYLVQTYNRLIELRKIQLTGSDAADPQIESTVNRINTAIQAIPNDIVRAKKAFDERFGMPQ